MRGQMSNVRLELVWPNKDKFLLSPEDENGKPVWVERSHPAAREVRLTEFTDAVGEVNDEHPESDNLLFVGDSIDALRILNETPTFRREYRGKVKLIYIDPPFNTGQTFIHYDDWMDHSTWLSFMRDRLLLLKELLTPDGSIWIHLDDAEQHRMRMLLDEIFGADNFVANVVWNRVDNARARASQGIVPAHDFITVYSRSASFVANRDSLDGELPSHYDQVDEQGRAYCSRQLLKSGTASLRTDRPLMGFPIQAPDGTQVWPIKSGGTEGRWQWGKDRVERDYDLLDWKPNRSGQLQPFIRIYPSEEMSVPFITWWPYEEVGSNRISKLELRSLFSDNSDLFPTPKPEALLRRVLQVATNPGDIVLDCFAGSGTTAAVSHKMGRRWVTVELSKSTAGTFTGPRLTSVVQGLDAGGVSGASGWSGGGGFRVVEVQDSFYAMTPLGVMLTDDANGPRFARSVAGQLGFEWNPTDGLLCAGRGRMRLAVLDGAVGVEEARQIVSELDENERVTIVARVILPGTEEWLSENSRGSICLKAPNDVLRERRKRRRSNGGEQ
jgi:adenine-specific DNA-methyltransferase